MAPKQPCAKYQYVVTPAGPKIIPVEEPSCKDEESPADYNAGGYLPVKVNDTFRNGRYRVVRKLGWGHFSTVWLVKDALTKCHSALKVVKSAGRYAETARDEIKLLSRVLSFSPSHPGRSHIVSFLDSFAHQGPEASHVCIVFEPLGENLLALIERNKKKGVPRPLVKFVAKQILLGLQYLHDECDLVHTDIKPENILISIPDIEAHIHNELSQSPSPTSRRVGVPLPTKSRAGVSIPYNSQRARRQVQIFDSQPLASPGRSVGRTTSALALSSNTRSGNGSGGSNSQNGSYPQQALSSRLNGHDSNISFSNSCSSVPKVSSGLALSASHPETTLPNPTAFTRPAANPTNTTALGDAGKFTSPSSSSSSISSTLDSTPAGCSSITSTPPTSLSLSLGNAVAGFMGMSKGPIQSNNHPTIPSDISRVEQERPGLPINGRKGKTKSSLEQELDCAITSPLVTDLIPEQDSLAASFSSYKSNLSNENKSKLSRPVGHHHHHHPSRSHSGISVSHHWKDLGTAALAPAVLVSAVAAADGQETPFFDLSNVTAISNVGESAVSECSSATATATQPSPSGTPQPVLGLDQKQEKPDTLLNGVNKVFTESSHLSLDGILSGSKASENTIPPNSNHPVSLLTQTAPMRVPGSTGSTSKKRTAIRSSPPQHVSQLSAHMHAHHPFSFGDCSEKAHNPLNTLRTKPSRAMRMDTQPTTILPTTLSSSITPTPASPTLVAPPPSPVNALSGHLQALSPISASMTNSLAHPPLLPPIETPHPLSPPAPISIKIADLGNATPSKKHYTEDIQTRQYRAPEAILGKRDWDWRADVWSVACVIFELLTAEYLFDPQGQGELFTKDDDHMAQIIELLGDFPMEVKMGGKYSRELFDHTGALRYIRTLKPWPLKRVMTEKYLFTEADAIALCDFLEPMLVVDMHQRIFARDAINHKWLEASEDDELITEW